MDEILGGLVCRAAEEKAFCGRAREEFILSHAQDARRAAAFCARMDAVCGDAYDLAITVWEKRRSYGKAGALLRRRYPELSAAAVEALMADAMYSSK